MESVIALGTGELGFDLSLLYVFSLLMLRWEFASDQGGAEPSRLLKPWPQGA